MDEVSRPRVLCVDDDPVVLAELAQLLTADFDVDVAPGGIAGLGQIANTPGYAVVLTELWMSAVDGITLLARSRIMQPDASRVLLTGQADLQSAARAVNDGAVQGLLTKPCPPDTLLAALHRAAADHAARAAERDVLTETVVGAIQTVLDLMSLANPPAHARAQRITREARRLFALNGLGDRWELDAAAMLSQIGSVVLPARLIEKLGHGHALGPEERAQLAAVPERSAAMVAHIPRMEAILDIIRHQHLDHDAAVRSGSPPELPLGARVLRVAADLDVLRSRGLSTAAAARLLQRRRGAYDPDLLHALIETADDGSAEVVERRIDDLCPGMRLHADVHDADGSLLIGRDAVLDERLIALLRSRMHHGLVGDRVLVAIG